MKTTSSKFLFLLMALVVVIAISSLSACNFAPVKSFAPTEEVAAYVPPTRVPTSTSTPMPTATPLPMEEDCSDVLMYIDDLTIDDGTVVNPGQVLDKKWAVQNSGTCNWGPGYTLQVTDNEDDVVVAESMALYPALNNSDVTIRVVFTAPEEEGNYTVFWKAYSPDGTAFGDHLSINFVVEPPTE